MPVVLTQFWLFVAPGCTPREEVRDSLRHPVVAVLRRGCLFSHYILFRVAWIFLGSFSTDYVTFMPRLQPTFSLYVRLTLACGVVFQMPTVVFFLARIGLLTARYLIRNTKYSILIIFIIAAVLTPTGDPATLTMMAAPMMVLYGLSIGIAWLVAPGTRRRRPLTPAGVAGNGPRGLPAMAVGPAQAGLGADHPGRRRPLMPAGGGWKRAAGAARDGRRPGPSRPGAESSRPANAD